MIKEKSIIKEDKGFVILFAVTLSAIILSIALGVANIAFREVKFGTNARDTNNAFFAADAGIEYVLFNDSNNDYTLDLNERTRVWDSIVVSGLGSDEESCAIVSITKDNSEDILVTETTIVSKGYNVGDGACESSNPDRVEREINVSY